MSKVISIANQNDFDIVQCHDENLLSFFKLINKPTFYTMHSVPEEFWKSYLHPDLISEDLNLVAVSNRQKEIFTQEGWKIKYVVHNGFDVDVNNFSDKYDYFFSLGILAPRKGHHLAIKVAKKLNKDLLIAGNMDDRQYFEEQLKPHITHDLEKDNDKLLAYKNLGNGKGRIIYVGKVNDEQKMPLYAHANAFFALSTFEDPLPGVVIETMACGTPVIGSKKGGIPEMIVDGKTGYIVDIEKIDEITDATRDIGNINPVECRKRYEQNFTSKRMAEEYLKLYNLVM
ncbi:MAG: glycosyltransferase [Candidatus Aenigmarchaeota archaeon]|nr:glycosyltransferase [Candidatus Aenigmarchaeota archaeon]